MATMNLNSVVIVRFNECKCSKVIMEFGSERKSDRQTQFRCVHLEQNVFHEKGNEKHGNFFSVKSKEPLSQRFTRVNPRRPTPLGEGHIEGGGPDINRWGMAAPAGTRRGTPATHTSLSNWFKLDTSNTHSYIPSDSLTRPMEVIAGVGAPPFIKEASPP